MVGSVESSEVNILLFDDVELDHENGVYYRRSYVERYVCNGNALGDVSVVLFDM